MLNKSYNDLMKNNDTSALPEIHKKSGCSSFVAESDKGNLKTTDDTVTGKCNWCAQYKELSSGKKFCKKCGEQGRQCPYCYRPMPDRFYTLSSRIRNSCFRKHAKQREKDCCEQSKTEMGNTFEVHI